MNVLHKKQSGIYEIRCSASGKVYVGSAVSLHTRTRFHLRELRANRHTNYKLQAAFLKYGEDEFVVTALEFCERSSLYAREQHWIDTLNAVSGGYNIAEIAGSPSWLGKKREPFSAEWRSKLSDVAKRPRPSQSKAMRLIWVNKKAPRVTLVCVDCGKGKEILESLGKKSNGEYRCRPCYLIAYSSGRLTTRAVAEVTCPDCGKVRDQKPSPRLTRNNYSIRCLSCARKGDLNSGSRRRIEALATNLSFLAGCS